MTTKKTHRFEPSDIAVVSEILSEVEVLHELKDESKWMLPSGIYSDERYHAFSRELSTRQSLMAKPLSVGC